MCQTLVSIATHTPKAWGYVTPRLMEYLEATPDKHEILVWVLCFLELFYGPAYTNLTVDMYLPIPIILVTIYYYMYIQTVSMLIVYQNSDTKNSKLYTL